MLVCSSNIPCLILNYFCSGKRQYILICSFDFVVTGGMSPNKLKYNTRVVDGRLLYLVVVVKYLYYLFLNLYYIRVEYIKDGLLF